MFEEIQQNFERIIALYEGEREANADLRSRLADSEASNDTYRKQITELERQVENLRLAEAFLTPTGSSDSAKERIDKLIKEINKCISLLEKVSAGRAGDAHFREHDDVSAYGCRLAGKADDLLCILRRIRKPHPRRDGGNSQNSVFAHDVANICEIAQKCPG